MSYKACSNRATSSVTLWLNNEEPSHNMLRHMRRVAKDSGNLAHEIRHLCERIWPSGKTPNGDLLSECSWDEIAAAEWKNEDDQKEDKLGQG